MTDLDYKKTLATPGQRLKYVRSLLRVSRSYLQDKYNLPEVTLKSWENGTTKLSQSGASRCIEAYRSEGIIVSEDWIMDGIGLDPKMSVDVSQYFSIPTSNDLPIEDDEIGMVRDANVFKENNINAVVMVVSNDDMRPFYCPGDYIGGKMRYGANIETAINKDCIVYLKTGERFFRRLVRNKFGGYNLTCLNPSETTSEPVLYGVDIDGVAPIIWRRQKDS